MNGDDVSNCIKYSDADLSRIIEMAWEDRIPFEAIDRQFGVDEAAVIRLMRQNLKLGSFKLWRARAAGRKTKHLKLQKNEHNAPTEEA